ncbi:monocarboxylate transporter 3-like [Dermacentor andersoni]|uniref:monocarboxylate transporter 3-like n=1 Tax=Dermacentor andersoni TaxID=34620 RepID=UPI003B3B0E5C
MTPSKNTTITYTSCVGTTLSGLYIASNVLVAQYFEKRRATACSLMFAVGGLNTIVFPPLIELFYSRYGVHAAFLLYGAILMNAFPCCVTLRDPPCRPERKNVVGCFERGLAPFVTLSFLVSAVSFPVVSFGMALYVMLSIDLAGDHGVQPSSSVYLLHAFSASDIVCRALSGVIIDTKILSLESVMLLGYLAQGAAFEMLAWFGTFHMMMIASALMGLTCGSRIALQGPMIAKDFGLKKLPVVMGAIYFCNGVALLLRPSIVGYFRDRHGSYSGLLHSTAAVNGLLVVVWMLKLRNGKNPVSPTEANLCSEEL